MHIQQADEHSRCTHTCTFSDSTRIYTHRETSRHTHQLSFAQNSHTRAHSRTAGLHVLGDISAAFSFCPAALWNCRVSSSQRPCNSNMQNRVERLSLLTCCVSLRTPQSRSHRTLCINRNISLTFIIYFVCIICNHHLHYARLQ